MKTQRRSYKDHNNNCNKILESDWLSAGPILAFISQFTRAPGVVGPHASLVCAVEGKLHLNGFLLSFINI